KIPPSLCRIANLEEVCRMPAHSLLVVTIIASESVINLISKATTVKQIGYWIRRPRFAKSAQPQSAGIAVSTRQFRLLITGPREVQRCAQLEASPNDLRLSHGDDGSPDRDVSIGFGADVEHSLKRAVKLRTAVGITRRVFRYGA